MIYEWFFAILIAYVVLHMDGTISLDKIQPVELSCI